MVDDVQITIGAKFDELIKGVDRAKTAILELVGAAGITEFIIKMGELGEKTETTMAALGMSAEQVTNLAGVAKLAGTDIGAVTLGIERMSLNIQRSTRDATNPAAQALSVLGLNAKDLIGIPTDQWVLKMAGAVSQLRPSLERTDAVVQLMGRGMADRFLPLLDLGEEGLKKFQAEVTKTGSELSGPMVRGLAETHANMTLVQLSLQGLAVAIYGQTKPAIDTLLGVV